MLKAYLTDTITLKQFMGSDKWGAHLPTRDVSVRVRVDHTERVIMNSAGQLVTSTGKVYMELRTIMSVDFAHRTLNSISYQDVLTIDGVDYPILRIAVAQDFRKRHMEVYIA
jgi:hypothetical protein